MYISELITGIILIIAGLLVKPFPNLIAGYNTLSKADKDKIDIGRLSTFMRNALVVLGIAVILIGLITKSLEIKQHYSVLISSTLIVLTVIFMAFEGNSFKKKN